MIITIHFEFFVNYLLRFADSIILINVDFILGSLTKNPSTSLRRINSSDVVNIGLECFFKQLCILNEEEAIFYLKNKALKEIEKELANSNIDLSKYDGLADLEDGKL